MQVKVSSLPRSSSVVPGRGDAFAVGVFQRREGQRHVAGVLDDDLVFDRLADFAFQFGDRVVDFAFDALELFDREFGVFGDVDDDRVGAVRDRQAVFGRRVAFDRSLVGVGAGSGEGVFARVGRRFAGGQRFRGPAFDVRAVGVA